MEGVCLKLPRLGAASRRPPKAHRPCVLAHLAHSKRGYRAADSLGCVTHSRNCHSTSHSKSDGLWQCSGELRLSRIAWHMKRVGLGSYRWQG